MRRWLIPLLLLLLVVLGGHALLWRFAEQQLEQGFSDWAASRRALGWTVTAGQPQRQGWPLAAALVIPDLAVSGGGADLPGGLDWGAGRVTLRVALLHPHSLTVALDGPQHLRLGDAPDIPFTADRLQAAIPLEPGVPARGFDLDARHLRAGLSAGGLTLASLHLHCDLKPAAPQGEAALSFTAGAGDVDLPTPAGSAWPLGARIASVELDGALMGPLPRLPGLYARAAGWRDGGGTLELHRVAMEWGSLHLSGSATLALDEKMQPMGAATARLVRPADTLDALAAGHAIAPRAALAAKAVLALMTRPPDDGGGPQVEVPVTLQDRALSVGRIPLTRLPELVWPDAP